MKLPRTDSINIYRSNGTPVGPWLILGAVYGKHYMNRFQSEVMTSHGGHLGHKSHEFQTIRTACAKALWSLELGRRLVQLQPHHMPKWNSQRRRSASHTIVLEMSSLVPEILDKSVPLWNYTGDHYFSLKKKSLIFFSHSTAMTWIMKDEQTNHPGCSREPADQKDSYKWMQSEQRNSPLL